MDQYYQDNMLLGMKIYNFLHRYAVNGKISGNLACISEIKNAAVVLYGPRGCGYVEVMDALVEQVMLSAAVFPI